MMSLLRNWHTVEKYNIYNILLGEKLFTQQRKPLHSLLCEELHLTKNIMDYSHVMEYYETSWITVPWPSFLLQITVIILRGGEL